MPKWIWRPAIQRAARQDTSRRRTWQIHIYSLTICEFTGKLLCSTAVMSWSLQGRGSPNRRCTIPVCAVPTLLKWTSTRRAGCYATVLTTVSGSDTQLAVTRVAVICVRQGFDGVPLVFVWLWGSGHFAAKGGGLSPPPDFTLRVAQHVQPLWKIET